MATPEEIRRQALEAQQYFDVAPQPIPAGAAPYNPATDIDLGALAPNAAAAAPIPQPPAALPADDGVIDLAALPANAASAAANVQQPAMSGVGYQAPAQPQQAGSEQPHIGPYSQSINPEQLAGLLAEDGGRGGMTAANRAAQQNWNLLNVDNARLSRKQGDLAYDLGQQKDKTQNDVADEMAFAHAKADMLNADAEKAEAEHAAKVQKAQIVAEDGRKAFLKASKDLDPNRMMGQAGPAVMFTLATALGALGQGLLKQSRNSVVDMIENYLDRDFQGQQARAQGLKDNYSMLRDQEEKLRQTGIDARAARQIAKGNLYEGLANNVAERTKRLEGAEAKNQGAFVQAELYKKANEHLMAGYALAAKPSGGAPLSNYERIKRQQEITLKQQQIQQNEVKTQTDVAKANANGGEDVPEAAQNRRLKIAQLYQGRSKALETLQAIRDRVANNKSIIPAGIQARLPNATNSEDLEKDIMSVVQGYAASRGGPITASDQKISEEINNISSSLSNPMTISDASTLRRVDALIKTLSRDRDAVWEGVNANDRAAIEKTITPEKKSARREFDRLNAKDK